MAANVQLLDLPTETLTAICEQLCDQRHTHAGHLEALEHYTPDDISTEDAAAISSALYALSRTCSRLRAVARPFLYYRPLPKTPPSISERDETQLSPPTTRFCGRLALLARTLCENPDLKPFVKSLHFDGTYWAADEGFGEGSPLRDCITSAFEEVQDQFEAPANQHWQTLPDYAAPGDPELECSIANTAVALAVLCSLPNIETLSISTWRGWRLPELRGDTLKPLRHVTVKEDEPSPGRNNTHPSAAFVQNILSAAPNAKSLTMRGAHRVVPIMASWSITKLTLQNCQVPRGELQALMAGFSSLQSLSLIHCSYSGWLRVRLLDGLLARKETLKHLKMDLRAAPPYRDYGCFRRPAVDAIASLSNLETLELSGPFGDDLSSSREPYSYFDGFIPPSVRYLSLTSGGVGSLARYHSDVLHLVQVAGLQFPNLQGLAFEMNCHKCLLPINATTESDCRHCANLRRSDERLSHELEVNGIERLEPSDLSNQR